MQLLTNRPRWSLPWDYLSLSAAFLLLLLWRLGHFLTPDEKMALDFAIEFLRSFSDSQAGPALGFGYPGVPPVWFHALGVLGLFGLTRLGIVPPFPPDLTLGAFLDAFVALPLPYYLGARVGNVLLVWLLVWLVYTLGRRLFEPRLAWLAAMFIAFDPTLLGYSRLAHMAVPHALLMLLAVLCWIGWLQKGERRWLLGAGLFTGLALATITISLILVPGLAGLAAVHWLSRVWPQPFSAEARRALAGLVLAWLLLLILAAVAFALVWPAMWTAPQLALQSTADRLLSSSQAGFGDWGTFWLGQLQPAGVGYYPLMLLLKLAPLSLPGLVLAAWAMRRRPPNPPQMMALLLLAIYVVGYLATMSFGSAKSVRFLLPALPALALPAAWGWLSLYDALRSKVHFLKPGLALVLGLTLFYSPAYLSYYNPLLGGWLWAPHTVQVGWGEGMSDAAAYLNDRPEAEGLTAAAWYDWLFDPYFAGRTLPLSAEYTVVADYAVFYVNQVQRGVPDPNLITYFQRLTPEHTVRLNGIDYAWVYRAINKTQGLPPEATVLEIVFGDQVVLEGYVHRVKDGEQIVTFYWRGLQADLPEYYIYVRAVDEAGNIVARSDSPPALNFYPTSRWVPGELIADAQLLPVSSEVPPGRYRLEVGVYDPQSLRVLPPSGGEPGFGGGILLDELVLP